jgi:hypothetical protein
LHSRVYFGQLWASLVTSQLKRMVEIFRDGAPKLCAAMRIQIINARLRVTPCSVLWTWRNQCGRDAFDLAIA